MASDCVISRLNFKKFSCATLISSGVDHQHDSDWNRVYRWPACGGGRTVFCNEANGSLMMRHCRCLLLWDLDTVVEMRTTRCHKFIQVSVITMLLGDIGREAGGMFARHRPCTHDHVSNWFLQRMHGVVTNSSKTFFHEQAYTVNTAKEVRPPCYIYHFYQSFHWVCLKCWITCAIESVSIWNIFSVGRCDLQNLLTALSNAACDPLHIFTLSIYDKIDGYADHSGASMTMQIEFLLGCRYPIAVTCFAGSDKTPTFHIALYKQNWHLQ